MSSQPASAAIAKPSTKTVASWYAKPKARSVKAVSRAAVKMITLQVKCCTRDKTIVMDEPLLCARGEWMDKLCDRIAKRGCEKAGIDYVKRWHSAVVGGERYYPEYLAAWKVEELCAAAGNSVSLEL